MAARGRSREVVLAAQLVRDGSLVLEGEPWPDLFAVCDPSGRLLTVNPPGGWSGVEMGEINGNAWGALGLPAGVVEAVERLLSEAIENRPERRRGGEARACRGGPRESGGSRAGRRVPARPDAGRGPGGVGWVIVAVRDVTAARTRREALSESERQYRLLAENSSDMISRHDPAGVYLYVSPASRTLVGFEPAAARRSVALRVHPPRRPRRGPPGPLDDAGDERHVHRRLPRPAGGRGRTSGSRSTTRADARPGDRPGGRDPVRHPRHHPPQAGRAGAAGESRAAPGGARQQPRGRLHQGRRDGRYLLHQPSVRARCSGCLAQTVDRQDRRRPVPRRVRRGDARPTTAR